MSDVIFAGSRCHAYNLFYGGWEENKVSHKYLSIKLNIKWHIMNYYCAIKINGRILFGMRRDLPLCNKKLSVKWGDETSFSSKRGKKSWDT